MSNRRSLVSVFSLILSNRFLLRLLPSMHNSTGKRCINYLVSGAPHGHYSLRSHHPGPFASPILVECVPQSCQNVEFRTFQAIIAFPAPFIAFKTKSASHANSTLGTLCPHNYQASNGCASRLTLLVVSRHTGRAGTHLHPRPTNHTRNPPYGSNDDCLIPIHQRRAPHRPPQPPQ